MKLGRRFKLTTEIDNVTALEIFDPLTIEFDIARNTASTLNTASFRIYNLSEKNRNLIFKDRYRVLDINGKRKSIVMDAGYKTALNKDSDLSTIFIGEILESYSYRQGPDIITYINALDGSLAAYNTNTNQTFEAGLGFRDIVKKLISSMKVNGVEEGKIGEIEGSIKTPAAYNGNVFTLLTKDYKDEIFIDLAKINKLGANEYIRSIGGKVPLISSATGLLGTPIRQGSTLLVNMLFEPQIKVGHLVNISSSVNKAFDGQYKVLGLKHSGIISGAVSGDCITTLQLFIGDRLLGGLKAV